MLIWTYALSGSEINNNTIFPFCKVINFHHDLSHFVITTFLYAEAAWLSITQWLINSALAICYPHKWAFSFPASPSIPTAEIENSFQQTSR